MRKKTDFKSVKETFKVLFDAVEMEPKLGGLVICHPYTDSCVVNTKEKGIVNLLEEGKEEENLKAFRDTTFLMIDEAKNLDLLFMLMGQNWRLTALKYTKEYLNLEDFSRLLADSWVLAENPNGDANVSVNELIRWFRQADKHILMEEEDYKIWEELPDELILYRGISMNHNPKGLSWTKNIKTAEWFKNRFDRPDNYMLKAKVKKEDMLCYFNTRNEDEIVVDTRHIVSERI